MLGFSLAKLLVLAGLIAIVWYGFKLAGRKSRPRVDGPDRDGDGAPRDAASIEDMTSCRVCGVFVPAAAARDCGREGCPYRG